MDPLQKNTTFLGVSAATISSDFLGQGVDLPRMAINILAIIAGFCFFILFRAGLGEDRGSGLKIVSPERRTQFKG